MLKRTAAYLAVALLALVVGRAVEAAQDRADGVSDLVFPIMLLGPIAVAHGLELRRALRERALRAFLPIWRSALAGAVAGAGLGIGLRLGMRAVALLAGQTPTLTLGGTLFVLGVGVFFGCAYGSLFAPLRRHLPERAGGVVFGCFLGAFFWFQFFAAAARDLRGVVSDPVIALLTTVLSSLWIGHGAALAWLVTRAERKQPPHGSTSPAVPG